MTKSEMVAFDIRRENNISYDCRIDLNELAEKYNIVIVERTLNEKVLGACKTKGIKRIVLLNDIIDYEKRKRFTLSHEIGHLLLGHGDQYCDNKSFYTRLFEKEANEFASELLLPSRYIKEYTRANDITCNDIVSVSGQFDISYSVASIAFLKQLEYTTVIIYNHLTVFSIFSTNWYLKDIHPDLHMELVNIGEKRFELKNIDVWFPKCFLSQCFVDTKVLSDGNYISIIKFA